MRTTVLNMVAISLSALLGTMSNGCFSEPTLETSEKLVLQINQAGFSLSPMETRLQGVSKMDKRVGSGCFEAYHHPTTFYLCLHHFKAKKHAIEASVALNDAKLPKGRFWETTVWGRTVVMADCRISDRPVARKLITVFINFEE